MGVSELQMSGRIKNTDELEFAIFCIENLALRLKTDAEHIYTALIGLLLSLTPSTRGLELISAIIDTYLQYKGFKSIC